MKDTQILSTFQELATEPAAPAVPAPLFNGCQVGVALRAVLLVELVVAVAALYGAGGFFDWLIRLSLYTGAALPATVAWLVVACAARRLLARLPVPGQYGAAVALGALSGAYGCGLLALSGLLDAPPWLASAASGALLSGALVGALALRERGKTPAATTARLAELQSRIRPHFLFNTLNTAIALVQIDPQRAESVLEDLAELFRQALSSPSLRSTLSDEVDLARRYLSIEQLRFGERITVRWELDEAASAAEVPALVLQPLVENAVRHGIEANPLGGWIVVRTRVQAGQAVLTVSNSVPTQGPTAATAGHGIALRNVRQRLKLMHDVEADFEAGLQKGEGAQPLVYVVRIAVPLPASSQGVPAA